MRDRNRRESARRRDFMKWQHSRERDYGHDQPWREERRNRFPDEPYGGDRDRQFAGERQSHRGSGSEGMRSGNPGDRRGADYRGDFGPEGRDDGQGRGQGQGWGRGYSYGFGDSGAYRNEQRSGRGWDSYAREGDRARGEFRGDERGSYAREHGGFGAGTDAWNAGGRFGFGPEEGVEDRGSYGYGSPYGQGDMNSDRAGRGDWRDSDWTPNRPARGHGTWAGDWADTRSNSGMAGNFAGRGPKEYRRSDDRIREEVCDLFTDDPVLDASEVSVKVDGGEITLMGTVTTRDQKRRAEEVAERVSGVRDVINQIRVNRGETTGGTTASQGREKTARGGATSQPSVAADKGDR
jgi:hypothetical protein